MKLKSIFKKKSKDTSNPIPETSNLGISTPASPTSPPPITHPSEQQAYTNDDSIGETGNTIVTDAAIKDHSQRRDNNNDGYRKSRKASNASSDDKPTRDNDRKYEKKQSSSSDDNKRERKKGNREKGSERSSTRDKSDRGDRDRKKGRDKGSERKRDRKKGRERGGEERKSRKNSKFVCTFCLLVLFFQGTLLLVRFYC